MAEKKKSQAPDELLSDVAEQDREAVLAGAQPGEDVSKRAVESSNVELGQADSFVNTEKTTPAERASFGRRGLITNHTPAGLPADVHQALVASSQLRRSEAMTFRDIQALLLKYEQNREAVPEDVRKHLKKELDVLESAALFDESARTLLEKYT